MSYTVARGDAVSVLHVVRDVTGENTVTGKAGDLTSTVLDPTLTASALPVTFAEIGTTGYYLASFTPDVVGNWLLTVGNPAGTDELPTEYTVQVVSAGTLADVVARRLTTRSRVRERLTGIAATNLAFNDLIDTLISEVSNLAQDYLGRCLAETTYTEYHDGTGTRTLWLDQGPVVSVASVNSVSYSTVAGVRTETLTPVNAGDYVIYGQRSEGSRGLGALRLHGSGWYVGYRNYKVVYTAGYDVIPEGVVHTATNWVVAALMTRELRGLDSKSIGDGTTTPTTLEQAHKEFLMALAPYYVVNVPV